MLSDDMFVRLLYKCNRCGIINPARVIIHDFHNSHSGTGGAWEETFTLIVHECDKEKKYYGRVELMGLDDITPSDDPLIETAKQICREEENKVIKAAEQICKDTEIVRGDKLNFDEYDPVLRPQYRCRNCGMINPPHTVFRCDSCKTDFKTDVLFHHCNEKTDVYGKIEVMSYVEVFRPKDSKESERREGDAD